MPLIKRSKTDTHERPRSPDEKPKPRRTSFNFLKRSSSKPPKAENKSPATLRSEPEPAKEPNKNSFTKKAERPRPPSGGAAYVPTHAASDFLRSATAPSPRGTDSFQNQGRRNSGESFRLLPLAGGRAAVTVASDGNGRRRFFERTGERDSGVAFGEKRERGHQRGRSRVMPTSPGLRKFNEAVSAGEELRTR